MEIAPVGFQGSENRAVYNLLESIQQKSDFGFVSDFDPSTFGSPAVQFPTCCIAGPLKPLRACFKIRHGPAARNFREKQGDA
jgi:hypothetical protein